MYLITYQCPSHGYPEYWDGITWTEDISKAMRYGTLNSALWVLNGFDKQECLSIKKED
jgi:hypothetical protein